MESQRSFLFIGLALVSFLLWQEWQEAYGPKPVQPVTSNTTSTLSDMPASTPSLQAPSNGNSIPQSDGGLPVSSAQASGRSLVTVTTDTLVLELDLVGGDVVTANLLKYPVEQDSDEPFSLLRHNGNVYIAQSGLIGANGTDNNGNRPLFISAQNSYTLADGQDTLEIPLTSMNDKIKVTKRITLTRGSHDIQVSHEVENISDTPAQFQQFAQLRQTTAVPESNMFMPTYRGAAFGTEEQVYEKYSFADIEDNSLNETTLGGWVAMLEHYFVSAWVPPQTDKNRIYSLYPNNDHAIVGFTGEVVNLDANDTVTLSSTLYVGPKNQDHLATLSRGLDLTVDYGVLWWISQPLFGLLQLIYQLVANWGVAIVLITIIVKGLMYPLTKKQYESMAKMRNLAPKMQQLKDRYGDDRQKMSQAMMELYKKDKVNPMGGCFPLLLQMPIFLALYWVLLESVELRHADFFLWITDLSVKDPYFVLPVLTGASMYLLQKLQPMTMTDPMQQKIMQFMPVFMSIFFLWFPAGLVLYWLISNVITLVQAKIIYASMEKRGIKTH